MKSAAEQNVSHYILFSYLYTSILIAYAIASISCRLVLNLFCSHLRMSEIQNYREERSFGVIQTKTVSANFCKKKFPLARFDSQAQRCMVCDNFLRWVTPFQERSEIIETFYF